MMLPYYLRLRSWLGYYKQKILLQKPACVAAMKNIDACLRDFDEADQLQFTSMVRNWVNGNSLHRIDQEHDRYAFKVPEVLCRLEQNLREKNTDRNLAPHLSCGPRSYAMKEILQLQNIESRVIDWFGVTNGKLNAHTMIEYFDTELQQWVLQDPDFNTRYLSRDKKMPLSASDALALGNGNVSYTSDGYPIENRTNLDNTVAGMFSIGVLYRNSYAGKRSVFYLKEKSMKEFELTDGRNFIDYIVARGQGTLVRMGNG